MEADIKREFQVLGEKLDTYIANQEQICSLRRKPLEEHAKDGPHFRDKLVKICESLRINWVLTMVMVTGAIGGFFWMLRTLKL